MNTKKSKMISLSGIVGLMISAFLFGGMKTYAADRKVSIDGQAFTLAEKDKGFVINQQQATKTTDDNTYGNFFISGDLKDTGGEKGVPCFDARMSGTTGGDDEAEVSFIYAYDDELLNADDETSWKLVDDDSKKVGDIELGGKAKSGTIIVQSSFDREHWMVNDVQTNVFKDTPKNQSAVLYTTVPNQLVNGCYYRVTIAYQTRKKTGTKQIKSLKIKTEYDYREYVEVYEFYIIDKAENAQAAKPTDTPKYNLNSEPENAGVDSEYAKTDAVTSDDIIKGCEIGQFYINGFSGNAHFYKGDESKKENPIFLKNVGDKVTLWFDLKQKDIEALNGNTHYKIHSDEKGADKYFHITPQNFKRGALIIRFTDYQNNSRTNVYTDYLASAATTTADTKVQLFEEGDYEVALDYEIEDSSPLAWKIPKPANFSAYRIFFKFSIRNSNCMVYPIDLKTGSELRVPYTKNGFKLDLARSRYLDLSIRKKVLSSNGLDLRESQISSDQAEFSDEGLYVFTVRNKVTEDTVSKVIYVGSDNLLKAYARYGKDNDNGEYTIGELIRMRDEGYTFLDDGRIEAPEPEVQEELDQVEDAIIANNAEKESSDGNATNVVNESMPEKASTDEGVSNLKVNSGMENSGVSSAASTKAADESSTEIRKETSVTSNVDDDKTEAKTDTDAKEAAEASQKESHTSKAPFVILVIIVAGAVCMFYFKKQKKA